MIIDKEPLLWPFILLCFKARNQEPRRPRSSVWWHPLCCSARGTAWPSRRSAARRSAMKLPRTLNFSLSAWRRPRIVKWKGNAPPPTPRAVTPGPSPPLFQNRLSKHKLWPNILSVMCDSHQWQNKFVGKDMDVFVLLPVMANLLAYRSVNFCPSQPIWLRAIAIPQSVRLFTFQIHLFVRANKVWNRCRRLLKLH